MGRGERFQAKQTKNIYCVISIKTNKRKPRPVQGWTGKQEERTLKGDKVSVWVTPGGAGKKMKALGHCRALLGS